MVKLGLKGQFFDVCTEFLSLSLVLASPIFIQCNSSNVSDLVFGICSLGNAFSALYVGVREYQHRY